MTRKRVTHSIQPELRRFVFQRRRFRAHLGRRLGATRTEFDALDEICEQDGLTPGDLGERLSLTSGSVTALIDRLERLGWATRDRHPDDRRKVVVRPTGLAQDIAHGEAGALGTTVEACAARFSAREQEVIERFLTNAADALAVLVQRERALGESPDVSG